MRSPHDRFFKRMISQEEAARDFVRYYLPTEIVRMLDLSTLEASKDTFVDADRRGGIAGSAGPSVAGRRSTDRGVEPMVTLKEKIVDRLEYLPEPHLGQVLRFVEFLTWQASDQDEPLLSVAGILSGEMLSAQEIEQELYGERKGT